MHVIATAGHVDHGKSTLIHRLTGIDPDRLAEEKARGLTIDLGFAWIDLPSIGEVGIVDVPGHERFIKNMLAGVGAVDATLFVVAANEGWKPQSQEHLDILDLLQVSNGVVAVTKSDTVDPETLEAVIDDVTARIAVTSLQGAKVLPVSAVTGDGVDALVAELDRLLSQAPAPPDLGRPRLWIDRSFTMKGSGTVVTGTLLEGGLTVGQEIEILPGHSRGRIRAIQSHRKQVQSISPGDRTAVNLTGLEHRVVSRGDVLVLPGTHLETKQLLAHIRLLAHVRDDPPDRGAFKLYAGSCELDAEVRFLGEADGGLIAVMRTSREVPLMFGDRVVLRESGRRQTIGGGVVLETHPPEARGQQLLERAVRRIGLDTQSYVALLLAEKGWSEATRLAIRSGSDQAPEAPRGKRFVFDPGFVETMERRLADAAAEHHRAHPMEEGLPLPRARQLVDMPQDAFEEMVWVLAARGEVTARGAALAAKGFAPALAGPEQEALMAALSGAGISVPTFTELTQRFPAALIRALVKNGQLVQVSDDLYYPQSTLDAIRERLRQHIDQSGPFTVATFRDLFSTTRKYAVPLLEFLDRSGVTKRDGDLRELRLL